MATFLPDCAVRPTKTSAALCEMSGTSSSSLMFGFMSTTKSRLLPAFQRAMFSSVAVAEKQTRQARSWGRLCGE